MIQRILVLTVAVSAILAAAGGMAHALQTQPAASQPMQITITGVEGMVQVRESGDKPWQKAVVGMTVTEGAEFRTGIKSAVRIFLPPDQTITLDRMGVMKLMQAIQQGNVVKTRVGMPYGRTRYDIEAAGLEHQSELVSPSSTLAIRGTQVSIYDQPPFAPSAVSLTGRAEYRTAKKQVAFGGKGQGKTDVSATTDNPAQLALLQTYVDPNTNFGRPEQDAALLNQLQSKGDIILNNGQLALAFGGPVTDPQLTDIIASQGRFNISLRWTGPGDFDMFVLGNDERTGKPYTLGNPSYPGSVFKDLGFLGNDPELPPVTSSTAPDGGRIKFDQIAFGGGGLELASWGPRVPQQGYTVIILYYDQRGKIVNYPLRSKFRVDAFLDGKSVPVLINFDEIANGAPELKFGPVYEGTASLIDAEKVLIFAPGTVNGDARLTAIDLSIEAVGDINGGTTGGGTVTPASTKKGGKKNEGKPQAKPAAAAIAGPKMPSLPPKMPAANVGPKARKQGK